MRFWLILILLFSAAVPVRATGVPEAIEKFSRGLPDYFSRMRNYVAREDIRQDVMSIKTGDLARRRQLVAEYQINNLIEEPSALWEFRFVREVDGKTRPDVDAEIARLASIRHVSALQERQQIANGVMRESLPGCYWHNVNLTLLAFLPQFLDYFEWTDRGGHFDFRQVRGPGLPEDFFDPRSPRHYPEGEIWLTPDGRGLSRLELKYDTQERLIRMSVTFESPGPNLPILPKSNVIRAYHPSSTGGALETETTSTYSDWRHFEVSTEAATESPK